MMFEFNPGTKVDTCKWLKTNERLKNDLIEIAKGQVEESDVKTYIKDMCAILKKIENGRCEEMLFLMYDEPGSMPADARVDFVYMPTYIAATIMMTALCRYDSFKVDDDFKENLYKVLNGTLGRNFLGLGYNDKKGLMDTLELFAMGDTYRFVKEYPEFNEGFTVQLIKALTFLETEICTGNVVDAWSRHPYTERGRQVLSKIKGKE